MRQYRVHVRHFELREALVLQRGKHPRRNLRTAMPGATEHVAVGATEHIVSCMTFEHL